MDIIFDLDDTLAYKGVPYPGILDLLDDLARDHRLYVCSHNSGGDQILWTTGMKACISFAVCECHGESKYPELHRLKVEGKVGRGLYFDDLERHVRTARKFGHKAYKMPTENHAAFIRCIVDKTIAEKIAACKARMAKDQRELIKWEGMLPL